MLYGLNERLYENLMFYKSISNTLLIYASLLWCVHIYSVMTTVTITGVKLVR